MRYAVISDIHGNVEALKAVLDDIGSRSIDATVCAGDIVGYYPDPEQCVELVEEHVRYSVVGNHDYAAIGRIDTRNFTFYAYAAMEWTKANLSADAKKYLGSLPLTMEVDELYFTHSSPSNPQDFIYVFPDSEEAIFEAFNSLVHRVNFIGHTHWPSIMVQDDERIVLHNDDTVDIKPDYYYLINVGSVGQPRNFDPRSCYAIYDTDKQNVSLVRVSYDYSLTQTKVYDNNLPAFLAERLPKGR
ncbi:MAG: metallophosphoesterase [Chitinivibrionales bacterium]|nr:metallophosphoesterase [Chitinivibrionales bacterium]MBD3396180.1 metallophosphoesterase [Chitinivibrionales bacterium]